MLQTKFQPNILSGSGEKVDFIRFAILVTTAVFDQAESYYSEALQSGHVPH